MTTPISSSTGVPAKKSDTLAMDPIKRVVGQARAKEARFVAEHGVSSAEFFGESGVSDAQDEAMQKREEIE